MQKAVRDSFESICLDSWCTALLELHCSISGRLCADRTKGSEHQSRNQTTSQ